VANSYSSYNFSDFINSLRVEQAKKFLSDNEFSQYTIVAIGLECGFNSKSTFYSAFKNFTSETPTTYRAQF
jgi:AraC-like DNA-binding protein